MRGTAMAVFVLLVSGGREVGAQAESDRGWNGISFVGGLASGSSDTGVSLGGAFTYELTSRVALEARGTYLDRGRGADAFDLRGGLILGFVSSTRNLVPYAAASAGIYRASFDLGQPRFLGDWASRFGPGANLCGGPSGPGGAGTGLCPFGSMPGFYGRRLPNVVLSQRGTLGTRSYTDPALDFGGGVRFEVGERVFIRPDARVLVVAAEGDTFSLGVFVMHVGYRF